MCAANQYRSSDFDFKASLSWVKRFKKKHNIRQRKITRYISHTEHITTDKKLEAAENFCGKIKSMTVNFVKKYIINTDQMGCQYQLTYDRTLAEKGTKCIIVKKHDLNKISHSYTAQYAITMSGEVLPHVFLCLQEPTGSFGPRVQNTLNALLQKFSNVVVTCSKSGKFSTEVYKLYLEKVIKSYVAGNSFLLIIDSWGGQTSPAIYDEIFSSDDNENKCKIKVIPPKCTAICQPCDVYLYRQIKIFIKKLQNCSQLIKDKREIATREDAIKIHSLAHHQISAPIFSDMIKYAWFASNLCDERSIFLNMNEVCFSLQQLQKSCACSNASFICCSRCRINLCFYCFYDMYHPAVCI